LSEPGMLEVQGADCTTRHWDKCFEQWVRIGHDEGVDPNDIGDREWNNPLPHLERYYFPHIRADSVVLELGPELGRITRHLIGHCRETVWVDYSPAVCRWLDGYLAGKGKFRTLLVDKPVWPEIPSQSVDFACAYGVFEHIDLDDMRRYLEEMHRVLVPGGIAAFNFDNLMNAEGLAWHKQFQLRPGERNVFRFYHPEMVRVLAEASRFEVLNVCAGRTGHADIELKKP
jgi:SAM-dependent methyltransferase